MIGTVKAIVVTAVHSDELGLDTGHIFIKQQIYADYLGCGGYIWVAKKTRTQCYQLYYRAYLIFALTSGALRLPGVYLIYYITLLGQY